VRNSAVRFTLIAALSLVAVACGSIKAVKETVSKVVTREESNAIEPMALEEFEPRVSVSDLWSKRVGKGADKHYLKLTPAVMGSNLYVADRYGRLTASNLESGEIIWEVQDKKLQYTGGPGTGDGLVLIGTGDARVIAREANNGKLRWVARVSSEVLAAPRAADGIAVVRTGDGKLYGLNSQSGAQIWVYDRSVPTLTLRGNAAPVIDDEIVLAGFDNGRLVALNLKTGKLLWESRLAIPSGRSDLERMVDVDGEPVVVGATVYVASFQGGVAAISMIDGQIEWTRDISSYAELAVGAERIFITDDSGSIWALDRHSGNSIWKQDGLAHRLVSGPSYFKGYIVVGDFEGYMHWLDAASGDFAFRAKIDKDRIISPAITAGNVLLSYSSAGRLLAMQIQ
jgi:outer membrane protein assembly factor BamB